jgi:hypothetical protein
MIPEHTLLVMPKRLHLEGSTPILAGEAHLAERDEFVLERARGRQNKRKVEVLLGGCRSMRQQRYRSQPKTVKLTALR